MTGIAQQLNRHPFLDAINRVTKSRHAGRRQIRKEGQSRQPHIASFRKKSWPKFELAYKILLT